MKRLLKDLVLLSCTFLPSSFRLMIWKWMGFRVGRGAHVSPLSVIVADTIDIGPGAVIGPLTMIYRPAKIVLGERSRIASFVRVVGFGELHLDQQTFVGLSCLIDVERDHRFHLGSRSQIGPRGIFYTHGATGLIFNRNYPFRIGDIVIGEDSWIGMACTIYPKVKIGNRCVITPGLVIADNLVDDSMLLPAANPWRRISVNFMQALPGASDDDKRNLMCRFMERLADGSPIDKTHDRWTLNRLLLSLTDKAIDLALLSQSEIVWTLDWAGPTAIPVFCFRKLTIHGPHTKQAEELAAFLCNQCGTHFVFEDQCL